MILLHIEPVGEPEWNLILINSTMVI